MVTTTKKRSETDSRGGCGLGSNHTATLQPYRERGTATIPETCKTNCGTPPMVNESKVFEVPLSPAGVYEIRVVLTTWGLYDSYVYIDTFKYRSQDTIGSVDESEMVNYLVIDGG